MAVHPMVDRHPHVRHDPWHVVPPHGSQAWTTEVPLSEPESLSFSPGLGASRLRSWWRVAGRMSGHLRGR